MASSVPISKSTCHARSNSLPSRSHPVAATIENNLCRLRASHTTTSSTSSICSKLENLKDLHKSLNDLIELPSVQQEWSQQPYDRWANQVLNGSVRLLDVCSTTKDIVIKMKESVKELQSSLRRNRSGESSLADEVYAYESSRRAIRKMVNKSVRDLKKFEKICSSTLVKQDKILSPSSIMLQESEATSFSVLKSVLLHLSATKDILKHRGWSLFSNVMQSRWIQCDAEQEDNVIQKTDDALSVFVFQKHSKEHKAVAVQNALKQLGALEMAIQELEAVLEAIFRSLIKRRVSLLNVLNH